MYTVHQHWDPLKVCAVGKSYPPEFYSRIQNPRVRNALERVAIETEEDYQKLIAKLEEFNVTVLRTDMSEDPEVYVKDGVVNAPPPMCPRDFTAMVGNTFYMPGDNYGTNFDPGNLLSEILYKIYNDPVGDRISYAISKEIEDCIQPDSKLSPENSFHRLKKRLLPCSSNRNAYSRKGALGDYHNMCINVPQYQKKIDKWCVKKVGVGKLKFFLNLEKIYELIISSQTQTIGSNFKFPNNKEFYAFTTIRNFLEEHNVPIKYDTYINSASMTRVGKDLFFSPMNLVSDFNKDAFADNWQKIFPDYNIHQVIKHGHSDGAFCPVKPGLIISLKDVQNYEETFPGWEVVHLPGQSWSKVRAFLELKARNKGKWWIPGEENNDELTDYVEKWLSDWVTYVEETVFDVNMLVINEQNVICNNYNKKVFDAFERHGITPHVINFRHRYFWDGGLHCITSDIAREGEQKNLFA